MILSVLVIGWPMLVRRRATSGASSLVYRSQLGEIDREEAAGLVSPEDARLARTEIQRRLIHSTATPDAGEEPGMTLTDRTTFIAVAAVLAIGSAALYGVVGSPGLSSASRSSDAAFELPGVNAPSASAAAQMNVPSVEEMISKLETRLKSEPDDVEGWRMLGWSRFRIEDFAGASKAYAEAVRLAPQDVDTLSAYGETLARAADGLVTKDAAESLHRALKLDPANARARFLLGLKKEQDGNPSGAIEDWLALLKDAKREDDWFDDVRGRVLELSTSAGIDVAGRLPAPRGAASAASSAAGPTASDIAQAQALPVEDRQAMIDGMVARLDARLKQNPNDLDGWNRLIRARRVLGQNDLAEQALADGLSVFKSDPNAQDQLRRTASEPVGPP
jgi:cytochrome c-type biogenesis protein CcmH